LENTHQLYIKFRNHKRIREILKKGFLGYEFEHLNGFSVIGKSVVITLLLCTLFSTCIHVSYADSFYPSGDSMNCEFAHSSTISIGSLPQNSDTADSIQFDSSKIKGELPGYIQSHSMLNIAELRYPNARRYLGVADRISVPPRTNIEFGFFYFNYSNHAIFTAEKRMFLNSPQGNLTNLLTHTGYNAFLTFNLAGNILRRDGFTVSNNSTATLPVSSWSNPPKGSLLASNIVADPLDIQLQEVKYHFSDLKELVLDYAISVRNISVYQLNNIEFKYSYNGTNHIETKNYTPLETYEYKFSINIGRQYAKTISLGYFTLTNPNSQTECAVSGVPMGVISSNPNSRMTFIARNDSNSPTGWFAFQEDFAFQPEGAAMCIERIPYKRNSLNMSVELQYDLTGNLALSSKNISNVKELNLTCENEWKSRVEIRNNSMKISDLQIKLSYNSVHASPLLVCGGIIVAPSENSIGSIVWDLSSFDYSDIMQCDIEWKYTGSEGTITYNLKACSAANIFNSSDGCVDLDSAVVNINNSSCISFVKPQSDVVIKVSESLDVQIGIDNNSGKSNIVLFETTNSNPGSLDIELKDPQSGNVFDIPSGVSNIVLEAHSIDYATTNPENYEVCLIMSLNNVQLDSTCFNVKVLPDPKVDPYLVIPVLDLPIVFSDISIPPIFEVIPESISSSVESISAEYLQLAEDVKKKSSEVLSYTGNSMLSYILIGSVCITLISTLYFRVKLKGEN
jgi:hypothetical protein